jgi:hypothetical protein
MRDYDDWKLDTPDNRLYKYIECEYCESLINQGDEYYKTDLGGFCDGTCFSEHCKETFGGRYEVYE